MRRVDGDGGSLPPALSPHVGVKLRDRGNRGGDGEAERLFSFKWPLQLRNRRVFTGMLEFGPSTVPLFRETAYVSPNGQADTL